MLLADYITQSFCPPVSMVKMLWTIYRPSKNTAVDVYSCYYAVPCICLDPSDLLSVAGESQNQGRTGRSTSSVRIRSRGTKLKKQLSSEVDLCGIGGRDSSLFLFRALGKILYCKS